MNKKELIEKYKELENGTFDIAVLVVCQLILKDLELLDEPQPVKVPQFVADWIERSKQEKRNLRNALNNGGEKMRLWFLDQENYDLFARAWLDGYEIQETRYVVTDGNHLYFKGYQEDVDIVILADEQPGTMEYVKKIRYKGRSSKGCRYSWLESSGGGVMSCSESLKKEKELMLLFQISR